MLLPLLLALADKPGPVKIPEEIALSAAPPKTDVPSVFEPMPNIYRHGWVDFNKNGKKDAYEDPALSADIRVDDLLKRMTVEEKTCQLATLYGWKAVLKDQLPTKEWKNEIWKDGIANIDEQLNSKWGGKTESPYFWPPSLHAAALNEIQRFFVEQTRLGIPVDFTNEGIQGASSFAGTHFPIPTGMGATWDLNLVHQEGVITGMENRLLGFTNVYAPILDCVRDQRWGRSEESFSESPFLLSRMGVALASGIQANGSAATAKHFAVYSFNKGAREGFSRTDPEVAPRMVEEIALKPFREVIREADLLGVMASYNDYDGVPIAASHYFLTDKLRGEYGFRGYVVSDSDAVEYVFSKHHVAPTYSDAVRQVVLAGLNVRTTFTPPQDFILPLRDQVKSGGVPMKVLDQRVKEVLRVKFWLGLFDTPYRSDLQAADQIVAQPMHQSVAAQASRESVILLKNDQDALPLKFEGKTIAVIGPNAENMDWAHKPYGPKYANAPSVLDSIRTLCKAQPQGPTVLYAKGCSVTTKDFPDDELYERDMTPEETTAMNEAVETAKRADIVVLVLGEDNRTSGESRTRSSLNLPGRQERLARAVAATGKPLIAVVIAGRGLSINWLQDHANAILYSFSPGAHGGVALAETLFGLNNPSGKLPITVPKSVGQIPLNFPTKPAANDEGIRNPTAVAGPLYPFGFGLSYSKFEYSDLRLEEDKGGPLPGINVRFKVRNTSQVAGTEVTQVYFKQMVSSVTTYERQLGGFARLDLKPGETQEVSVTVPFKELEILNKDMKWVVEPGDFTFFVGGSSVDTPLKGTFHLTSELACLVRT